MITRKAVVFGVGDERGLGAALCRRFAAEGHHVLVAGRTRQKLERVAGTIQSNNGKATAVVCDVTEESAVEALFDQACAEGEDKLDLVVYNVGNSTPGAIREMSVADFENAWRRLCLGGFIVGRAVTRRLLPGQATLLFTGASASLRGKSGFGAFNSGKSALRILAQALSKEYAAEGLHVGHVVIDGGIGGERQFKRLGREPDADESQRYIDLDSLTDAYWALYRQQPTGWTFELDIRTALETW